MRDAIVAAEVSANITSGRLARWVVISRARFSGLPPQALWLVAGACGAVLGWAGSQPQAWPLAGLALWGWWLAMHGAPRHATGLFLAGAWAWGAVGLSWVGLAVRPDADGRWAWMALAWLATSLHFAACLALPWALARWGLRRAPPLLRTAWAGAFSLVAAEVLQRLGWFGHGYGSLAAAFVEMPGAAALLQWGGAPLLTAWVAGLVASLTWWTCVWRERAAHAREQRARPGLAQAVAPRGSGGAYQSVFAGAGLAWWALPLLLSIAPGRPAPQAGDAPPAAALPLTLLQAQLDKTSVWTAERRDAQLALLADAVARTPPGGVVIGPEGLFPEAPPQVPQGRWADLLAQAAARDVDLVLGMPFGWLAGEGQPPGLLNAVVQVSHQRLSVAGKARLVPFAEYLPWPDALGFVYRRVFQTLQGEMAAPPPLLQPLGVQGTRVVAAVCHDMAFGADLAARAAAADWVLVLAEDGWVGRADYLAQMVALTRLRAMETGKTVVRVANRGATLMVSPDGQVQAAPPAGAAGLVNVGLAWSGRSSFFAEQAGWLAWLPAGLMAGLTLILSAGWRRRHGLAQEVV